MEHPCERETDWLPPFLTWNRLGIYSRLCVLTWNQMETFLVYGKMLNELSHIAEADTLLKAQEFMYHFGYYLLHLKYSTKNFLLKLE